MASTRPIHRGLLSRKASTLISEFVSAYINNERVSLKIISAILCNFLLPLIPPRNSQALQAWSTCEATAVVCSTADSEEIFAFTFINNVGKFIQIGHGFIVTSFLADSSFTSRHERAGRVQSSVRSDKTPKI